MEKNFKVRINKDKLRELKNQLSKGKIEINYVDEENVFIEKWIIDHFSVIIEKNDGNKERFEKLPENNKLIRNMIESGIREKENNDEKDIEMEDNVTESEEEMTENERKLIKLLSKESKAVGNRIMGKNMENLDLKSICYRIRRHGEELCEDYYYLGKRFGERLSEEMSKRQEKKKYKRDQKERERIYKEMLETGVEQDLRAIKRMVIKAEKTVRLIDGIGKEKLKSRCNITAIDRCRNEEIRNVIRYFKEL